MALLGDAISHSILLGIVLAFLITGDRGIVPMFIGASLIGLLTAWFVQLLGHGGVSHDAAIGVTFTAFFAFGVILLTIYAGDVHFDLEHVLFGEIAYVPWDWWMVGDVIMGPRALWTMAIVFALDVTIVSLFFKEFKLVSFDPGMATALGISVGFFHYLLMGLVSVTAVSAFESVGAVLTVAMLVVPGATAHLLTDNLVKMLIIGVVVGILSAAGGYGVALVFNSSISGAMTVVAGLLFTLALLFSPSHGVVSKLLFRQRLGRAEDNVLQ